MQWKKRHLAGLIACLVVTMSIAAYGQVLKGSISGNATDPEGAVIAGAQVKATNMATGAVLTTTSDTPDSFAST